QQTEGAVQLLLQRQIRPRVERLQREAALREDVRRTLAAVDDAEHARHLATRGLHGLERLERRAARGHRVLDERDGLAGAEGALDALAESVLLGLLAHEEAGEVRPRGTAARGGREQHRGHHRHGGHDHPADRLHARPRREALEEQAPGQLDAARAHHRGAQVEVEVALLAARQHDAAALEAVAQDQVEQLAALGGGVFARAHCLRIPSAYSAISFVWSSLVPSPYSIAFASSSSRPISYSADSP